MWVLLTICRCCVKPVGNGFAHVIDGKTIRAALAAVQNAGHVDLGRECGICPDYTTPMSDDLHHHLLNNSGVYKYSVSLCVTINTALFLSRQRTTGCNRFSSPYDLYVF